MSSEYLSVLMTLVSSAHSGSALYGASLIVKQFPVRRCGHEKNPISAVKCLSSLVKKKNPNHLIIATQDKSLVTALRLIPEVPVITLKGNALTLLKPPKDLVEKATQSSSIAPVKEEIEQIKQFEGRLWESHQMKRRRSARKSDRKRPIHCHARERRKNPQSKSRWMRRRERENEFAICREIWRSYWRQPKIAVELRLIDVRSIAMTAVAFHKPITIYKLNKVLIN